MIALFILNYIFSRSALLKSQSMQHKMERDRFEQMAYTDFLTKVHNRTYMNKIMNTLNHSGEKLGIVVCDIDQFKLVNDTYNHAVGDSVIRHFAAKLKDYLDNEDYLFRSGGEEFTMILRNRTYLECRATIEKIQNEIQYSATATEYRDKEIKISCTASFGLYYFTATAHTDIKRSYVEADELLFQAKNRGKNQVSCKSSHSEPRLSAKI